MRFCARPVYPGYYRSSSDLILHQLWNNSANVLSHERFVPFVRAVPRCDLLPPRASEIVPIFVMVVCPAVTRV